MQKSASAWMGSWSVAADHGHAASAQDAGEGQFADALGQGHHGGQGHGRRPAHEDVHPQPLLAADGGGVMGGDAAMDLVVQPDLAVRSYCPPESCTRYMPRFDRVQARAGRGLRCRLAAR